MSEFHHQCALFDWARRPDVQRHLPQLDLLEASLNGVHLSKAQAGKAYASGMLRGALDINLPVARGVHHGLRIEMKFGKNKMTDDQKWYAERLREEGWRVECCWDWEEAREIIIDYLTLKDMFPLPSHAVTCDRCGFTSVVTDDGGWQDEFFQGASP